MIAMIDWVQIAFLLLGSILGGFIGYRVNCWRFRTGAPGVREFAKHAEEPARSAALLGLAAFAGCTVAYGAAMLLHDPKPDTVVLKYLFGTVIGIGHYIFLKRVARESATTNAATSVARSGVEDDARDT